jgi:hypothetical protein
MPAVRKVPAKLLACGAPGAARERRDRPHDRAAGGAQLLMDDRPAQRRDEIEPSDQPPGRRVQLEDRDRQLHQQVRGRAPARLVPQPSVQPGEEPAGRAGLRRRGDPLPQQACGQGALECSEGAGEAEGEDDQGQSQDGTDERGGERDAVGEEDQHENESDQRDRKAEEAVRGLGPGAAGEGGGEDGAQGARPAQGRARRLRGRFRWSVLHGLQSPGGRHGTRSGVCVVGIQGRAERPAG